MECEFGTTKKGRIFCKTHQQSLMYLYKNGKMFCQVGEDLMVSELGGLDDYLKWINTPPKTREIKK